MVDFSLREMAPGISAVLGGVCNRGLVSDGGHVLVVDAGISGAEAAPLRAAADQRRSGGGLLLFNTHHHGDHVFGNQAFADGPIVAQRVVRATLVAGGEESLAVWRRNPTTVEAVRDVTLTLPTVTFAEEFTVYIGDTEVRFLHCGRAHSPSDSVAWLPVTRTLFAGDLLFNDLVPALPSGSSAANWLKALERLEALGAEQVIPGHGPIQSPVALGELRGWLEAARALTAAAVARGDDRERAAERVARDMQSSAPRGREERLPNAIGSIFDEIRGNDVAAGA